MSNTKPSIKIISDEDFKLLINKLQKAVAPIIEAEKNNLPLPSPPKK
jgi:predicted house-cleaning noncanonical NTP pyrophosphatase (MazG superfamily)